MNNQYAKKKVNLLYYWHAVLSAADEQWMEGLMKKAVTDANIEDLGPMEFRKMRNPDGHFDNHALGELIKDAIEEPANAFGAGGTPSCMKVVDALGRLQARNVFNVCTMNEFRDYLNLSLFKSFEEWNRDPEIAHAAETLYGHIDQLELYPGLLAEDAKPNMPGSGIQPGHTIGRGILDDAVALVRGDRFLTHDLSTSTLINWDVAQLTPAHGAHRGVLSNLLFNALPNSWLKGFYTYCLLPFYTPNAITCRSNQFIHL